METLPEKIASRIIDGKGRFKTKAAALRTGDCQGGIMDTKIGASNVEIMMRFSGGRWPGRRVITLNWVYGVMVSHLTGHLTQFVEDMEVMGPGQQDGVYEVIVSEPDTQVDRAAVYAPYEGPEMWNGRP